MRRGSRSEALLITFISYHWVFAIMATATAVAVAYLTIALHGRLFSADQQPVVSARE